MSRLISYAAALMMVLGAAGRLDAARGCTGADNCKACKNCSSCRHCAKSGGSCGVCTRPPPEEKENLTPAPPAGTELLRDAAPVLLVADDVDPRDAEIKMLRAAVKKSATASEPLRAKVRALQKELAAEKAGREADDTARKKQIAALEATIAELRKEGEKLERELRKHRPGQVAGPDPDATVITTKRLETMGEKLARKKVALVGCRFVEVSDDWIDQLPGVTISSNGLQALINVNERQKWIGFRVADDDDHVLSFMFADKEEWGEFLLTLKRGQILNVKGFAIELRHPGWYGVASYEIEKVGEVEEEEQ